MIGAAQIKAYAKATVYRAVYSAGERATDGGITILSYHSVDNYRTGISVPPGLFEEQMATLAAEGCPSFTMSQVAEHLRLGQEFPPRAVAVTFDDGFANVLGVGAPVLARYGITATVYMITGMVGRATQWTAYGASLPSLPLLGWDEVEQLRAQGIEIGSHTHSHGFLTRCTPDELKRELQESKAILEDKLGTAVGSFAYPQGDYSGRVVRTTRAAGYTSAVTIDQGRASISDDPFRLRRLHVGGNTTAAVIKAFTVPAIGPTYRVVNVIMKDLLRRKRWPRPDPRFVDSTGSVPPEKAAQA